MRKAFNLRAWNTRFDAPQLKGKKMLGRGAFAAVFEGSRANTVYKLTSDSQSYMLLCDGVCAVKSRMLPRLVNNFGEVGEAQIGRQKFSEEPNMEPLYLIEVERLNPIRRSSANKHLALLTEKISSATRTSKGMEANWSLRENALTPMVFDDMAKMSATFPVTMRNLFKKLSDFARMTDDTVADLHSLNFMQRDSGEFVVSDPVCSYRLHTLARK